jgi:hypothetical protein
MNGICKRGTRMFERSDARKVARPALLNPAEKYPRLSRPLGTGPQWGFCGASIVEVVPVSPVALAEVTSRLGLVISPGDETFTSLELMRARFLRRLRQDEFGPTNADCSAALRQLMSSFDRVSKRLRVLGPRSRGLFSGSLANVAASASERISLRSVIDQIGIAASDLARVTTKIDKGVRRRQFDAIADAADRLFFNLNALDSRSQSELELAALRPDLRLKIPPLEGTDAYATYLRRLTLFRDQISRTIKSLGRGPEKPSSLYIAVWQLADFFQKVTGRRVTSNGYKAGVYTSRPQSEAGLFILDAIRLLMPPPDWYSEELVKRAPNRTRLFIDQQALERTVHLALGDYVTFKNAVPSKKGGETI